MRTQQEIEIALKKLNYKYKNKPNKVLGITINNIYFYSKNMSLIHNNDNYLFLEWLRGNRNTISKIIKRIKI